MCSNLAEVGVNKIKSGGKCAGAEVGVSNHSD